MEYVKEALSLVLSGDRELWQIIGTTLIMAFFSTAFSSLLGIPLGTLIGRTDFRGKGTLLKITNTLMGLPPVVAGLVVFMLFRAVGPFGSLKLMFSVRIMIIAQVILITPLVCSMTASCAGEKAPSLTETANGLGLSRLRQISLLLRECSSELSGIILMAYGRSIAEVGAVSLVGGNIQFKTRVMTTAILLEANKGDFRKALALGMILMLISLFVNIFAYALKERVK